MFIVSSLYLQKLYSILLLISQLDHCTKKKKLSDAQNFFKIVNTDKITVIISPILQNFIENLHNIQRDLF